jgi:hypothetical protein
MDAIGTHSRRTLAAMAARRSRSCWLPTNARRWRRSTRMRRTFAAGSRWRATASAGANYRYFKYPLPALVEGLRIALFRRLAAAANEWNGRMGIDRLYPGSIAAHHGVDHVLDLGGEHSAALCGIGGLCQREPEISPNTLAISASVRGIGAISGLLGAAAPGSRRGRVHACGRPM